MKQVGINLLVMAVLGLIAMSFQLQGPFWEALFILILMGASAFVPSFKQVLGWKFHWRIALVIALVCTFVILWQIMERFMGKYQQYSLPATLIVLSILAFLFHFLDNQDAK